MRMIKIVVTQEDIDHGLIGSCWNCPAALAIGRYIRESEAYVHVGGTSVSVGFKRLPKDRTDALVRNKRWLWLPPEAVSFIARFDASLFGSTPKPIEFEVGFPENEDWYYDVR